MTCREFAEFLDAWLAGELSPEERAEFERHLAVCDNCIAYLDSYRRTVDICRAIGKQPPLCNPSVAAQQPPADVPEDLVRAILASRKQP